LFCLVAEERSQLMGVSPSLFPLCVSPKPPREQESTVAALGKEKSRRGAAPLALAIEHVLPALVQQAEGVADLRQRYIDGVHELVILIFRGVPHIDPLAPIGSMCGTPRNINMTSSWT